MAFDASRQAEPDREPAPPPMFADEPIDWLDWGMRIAVFGPLLGLYLYWIWTISVTVLGALVPF